MTSRATRNIYDIIKYATIICGVIGGILAFIAAGMSDFYIDMKQAVPGDQDLKLMYIALLIIVIAMIGVQIMEHVDFSNMYDLESIPVYYSANIRRSAKGSKAFKKQVSNALDSFYNGDWGRVEYKCAVDNDRAVENGIGTVHGVYSTIYGTIYLIAASNRSEMEVLFENEYV